MRDVSWRAHLRPLEELGPVAHFDGFEEVDEGIPFLTGALDLPQGSRLVELGCGRGGYAIRLAQWGYRVTGIEDSDALLADAWEAARQREVSVEFRRADLRSLRERSCFDGALLLDFGAFSDADNAEMLRAVAAALRPGGRLVCVTCNPYFWAREPRTVHRVLEGVDVIRRYTFDFAAGVVASRVRCILPHGERRTLPEARYRAYTLPELKSLVAAVGLADLRIYGQDESGQPRTDLPLDNLRTPFFHAVALRPVTGEAGEGI